jgi:uncharacterized membrane protein
VQRVRPRPNRRERSSGLLLAGVLVLATVPTFVARATCIEHGGGLPGSADWCYTEIARLAIVEHVIEGRVPYVDPCPPGATTPCDEYPVLTMFPMWAAARVGQSSIGTYLVAAIILLVGAALTTWLLWTVVGIRALYFAAAPTLLMYGPLNWDLVAVATMTAAAALFLRGRQRNAGIAAGIGTAAKLMPGIACAPMTFLRDRSGRLVTSKRFALAAIVAWLVVNVPLATIAPRGWSEFFRYNAVRPVDVDSLWSVGCHVLVGHTPCASTQLVNLLSAALFIVGAALVWRLRSRRDPSTEPWTMGFAMLALFFLTSKVYSPQYDLFLLPWFALVLPDIKAFAAFEASGIVIFFTRFQGFLVPSLDLFHIAVVIRALVLMVCVGIYVTGRTSDREPSRRTLTYEEELPRSPTAGGRTR